MADGSVEAPATTQRMSAGVATLTWVLLVGATVLGWALSQGGLSGAQAGAIIAIAASKVYLVIAVFMGLWRAPVFWHASAIIWIVVTFGVIWGLVA
ncbi:MAG: cytochrome C oxidase subunit IV family protein [Novosphingobium sp.]